MSAYGNNDDEDDDYYCRRYFCSVSCSLCGGGIVSFAPLVRSRYSPHPHFCPHVQHFPRIPRVTANAGCLWTDAVLLCDTIGMFFAASSSS